MSSVLLGGPPPHGDSQATPLAAPEATQRLGPGATPPLAPGATPPDGAGQRNGTLTVIAGVGVLLLAMGVGVLIGRSGASKQSAAPPQVITVASAGLGAAASTTAPSESSFTDSWPSGTSGYTVQLQTLPQSGTAVSAVEAAKSTASAKGAKAVGALKSEEFSSLTAGNYVIYSGVYHKKAEAEKALRGLRKSFPDAKVIKVSNGGSSSAGGSLSAHPRARRLERGRHRPRPPCCNSLKGTKGKTYEEQSKNLPNVVETG